MELIISKKETIPSFDPLAVAVKYIEYYPSYDGTYSEDEITPELIAKILKEVRDGISIYLFLDPDGECDWMEVLSDGEWLSLGCCFWQNDKDEYFFTYNPDYADTAAQALEADYSNENVWTMLESGGQSPVPKIQSITDMEAGVKAVEYFIRTGELYPGIDWVHEF